MAGFYNLQIDQGSYFSMLLEIDDEGLDFTGASAKMELRDCHDCNLIVSADCSIQLPNRVFVELSQEKTKLIENNTKYDLDLILSDGKILSILTGNVEIREKINNY